MFTKIARSLSVRHKNVGSKVRLATFRKPFVAVIAIGALAVTGVPLAGSVGYGSLEGQQSALNSVLARIPSDLQQARSGLERNAKSSNRMVAGRAQRALTWLNIMEAGTPVRRRELIRTLPVSVVRSAAVDGRGTIVKYVANGKTRFERFEPTMQDQIPEPPELSGPMVSSSDRAATVPTDECYDGPAPCFTQEEMDDLGIEIAWLGADLEAAENEYNQTCSSVPQSCSSPRIAELLSGPATNDVTCGEEAEAAVIALITGVGAYLGIELGYQGAVASGLKLTRLGGLALYGSIASVGFVTGYYLGYYLACAWSIEPLARDSSQESWGWAERRIPSLCSA